MRNGEKFGGIAGVRRMRVQLYPDDIEDRDVTPKAGGILGGFNPNKRAQAAQAAKANALAEMAEAVAKQGRGQDTEVAHVALGEIVVPRALQNAEVMAVLRRAAAGCNIPFGSLRVGHRRNSINPATGAPEFWLEGIQNVGEQIRQKARSLFGGPSANGGVTSEQSAEPTGPVVSTVTAPNMSEFKNAPGVGDFSEIDTSFAAPRLEGLPLPSRESPLAVKQIDSGIVQNPPLPPQPSKGGAPYDPRLVPNREADLQRPEVRAFLDAVSQMEGAGYHTLLGTPRFPMGRLSPDQTHFPNRASDNNKSAAGAYQIQQDTYDDLAQQMGLSGFDARTQDLMAAQLLQRANGGVKGAQSALEALREGNFDKAVALSNRTWTSLPGGKEQGRLAGKMREIYNERLKLYQAQKPQV